MARDSQFVVEMISTSLPPGFSTRLGRHRRRGLIQVEVLDPDGQVCRIVQWSETVGCPADGAWTIADRHGDAQMILRGDDADADLGAFLLRLGRSPVVKGVNNLVLA